MALAEGEMHTSERRQAIDIAPSRIGGVDTSPAHPPPLFSWAPRNRLYSVVPTGLEPVYGCYRSSRLEPKRLQRGRIE
eukprot:3189834-Pyramimonas_sp.AAC.1